MPETVSCNGTLVFAETCAFFNQLMNTSLFRLRVGLLRETNGVYWVINRSNININSNDPNATQGCGNLTELQQPVNQGDRIGVQIMDTCVTSSHSMPICPAQANLIDTTSCASALYLPRGTSPLTNFRTVGVNLNIRVSIGEYALSHTVILMQLFNLLTLQCQQYSSHLYCLHAYLCLQLLYNLHKQVSYLCSA